MRRADAATGDDALARSWLVQWGKCHTIPGCPLTPEPPKAVPLETPQMTGGVKR